MKKHPILIGLLQALCVIVYVAIISSVMYGLDFVAVEPPIIVGIMTVLLLLVVSAAFVGSAIFAYPAVLAMHKKTKKALQILASTLGWIILLVAMILLAIFI